MEMSSKQRFRITKQIRRNEMVKKSSDFINMTANLNMEMVLNLANHNQQTNQKHFNGPDHS
jgi:hypothetical protein